MEREGSTNPSRDLLPAWGGGAGSSSRKNVLSLQIGTIICLFIIGPRVNSLKGVTAHHSTESQSLLFLEPLG